MTKRRYAVGALGLIGIAVTPGWIFDHFWANLARSLLLVGFLILGIRTPKEELIALIFPRASDETHSFLNRAVWLTLFISSIAFAISFLDKWFFGAAIATFLLLLLLVLLFLGTSVLLSILGIIAAFSEGQSTGNRLLCAISGLAMPVVVAASVVLFMGTGHTLGISAKLLILRGQFEDIIAEAARRPKEDESALSKEYATAFYIDYGPPIRAAFPGGFGFLDNWSGIVYDPTGDVMLADGWDPDTDEWRAPERITKLFYGDLVSCRPLWGNYYHCSFT